ncbi:hypothetical protein Q3W71_13890 [Micromonospora sp. C28SCA-DRY-2]|uniref:hypothetical protein n=1 Tax=Micromonospora sp. C28SCA-DRY-2 TaxID=3059522 RepID=UPI0026773911|nr:hypothetical protein [Micromonospora sp. C28SCA-DRY-2]MDO3702760.1 hypothetical protein [Micromonospora sp. C28SCA-DRY-2]
MASRGGHRYRDPAASEPSDSEYRSRRVLPLVLSVAMPAVAVWWFTGPGILPPGGGVMIVR